MENEHECCNKDCNNTFSFPKRVNHFDPEHNGFHIYSYKICGGGDTLCEVCEKNGYKVYSGKGDGRINLSQHEGTDKEVNTSYHMRDAYTKKSPKIF